MDMKKIRLDSIALLAAAAIVLCTGYYTDNGGFQLAGGLILLGGVALAYTQARK
ncbi:MAG: hypothetical protein KAX84_02215 [Burkholderiales bacterium]|nr:hypothetical protein [Betaproteobacteria bacterium]MBP8294892.1 hypothetical protein [Burkholderiales bacterium]